MIVRDMRGNKNPNWKGGAINKICHGCGKKFEIQRDGKRSNSRKYCSQTCARKVNIQKMLKVNKEKGVSPLCGQSNKGMIPWNKNRHGYLSKEARENIAKANKERIWTKEMREKSRKSNSTPERIKQQREIIKKTIIRYPTTPERRFIELSKKYNLPYTYVGDGKFWIEWLNPDFVNCNGKKVVVEIFGDYWHNRPGLKNFQTEDGRKKLLKKYGWDCIIIWENELDNEQLILDKLGVFDGST